MIREIDDVSAGKEAMKTSSTACATRVERRVGGLHENEFCAAAPTTSLHLLLELASSKWSDAPITCTRWRVRRSVQCVEGAGERRRGLLAGRACTPHRVRLRISEDGRTGVGG